MKPTLDGLAPVVSASAVAAGTIASRNGSATVAPTPRRNVRLGNAVLVRNMCDLLPSHLLPHLEGRPQSPWRSDVTPSIELPSVRISAVSSDRPDRSSVRHLPTTSKFSSAKPIGSIVL